MLCALFQSSRQTSVVVFQSLYLTLPFLYIGGTNMGGKGLTFFYIGDTNMEGKGLTFFTLVTLIWELRG